MLNFTSFCEIQVNFIEFRKIQIKFSKLNKRNVNFGNFAWNVMKILQRNVENILKLLNVGEFRKTCFLNSAETI